MVEGWSNTKLGNVVIVDPENLKSSTDPDYTFRYISLSDINNGKITDDLKSYAFKDAPSRARRVVSKGDVLLATVRPNLESFTKIKYHVDDLICSTGFAVLRSKVEIDSEYLYQYLYSKDIKSQIERLVVGSSYPAINSSDVKNLKLLTPPLPEQKKIADILSTVDEAIQNTKAQIEKTKALKRGLMQQLFSKGIGHTEFKDSKLGRIPREWEVVRLVEVSNLITDGSHFSPTPQIKSTGYKIASVKDLKDYGIIPESCTHILKEEFDYLNRNNCVPIKGDVLLSKDGTVGKTCVWKDHTNISLLSSIGLIRVDNSKILPIYLKHFLDSGLNQSWLKRTMGGSALQRIVLRDIRNLSIPIASLEEQNKISDTLSIITDKRKSLENILLKLVALKKGLMQKLLTGEVRVKI